MVEVHTERIAIIAGILDNTILCLETSRCIELGFLVTSAQAHRSVGQQWRLAIEEILPVGNSAFSFSRTKRRQFCIQTGTGEVVSHLLLVPVIEADEVLTFGIANILAETHLRLTCLSALGSNDDYPRIGTGTINSSSRRAFQNLNTLDFIRVKIRNTAGYVVLVVGRASSTGGVDNRSEVTRCTVVGIYPINDVQRLRRTCTQRRYPAKLHVDTPTGAPPLAVI